MDRKTFLIISLFIILSTNIFATQNSYDVAIEDWSVDLEYKSDFLDINTGRVYIKKILETTFSIPEKLGNKTLYLNIENHIGFSKIYINDSLIESFGSAKEISCNKSHILNMKLPTIKNNDTYINKLKIENYSQKTEITTKYSIIDRKKSSILATICEKSQEVIPGAYFLIALFVIILLNINKIPETYHEDRVLKIAILLFALYFLISNEKIVLSRILGIASLSTLTLYYILNHNLWNNRKKLISLTILSSSSITLLTLYTSGIIILYTELLPHIIFLTLNIILTTIVFKTKKKDQTTIKMGLIISLLLNSISILIIAILKKPIYGITQTGFLIIIITFYIELFDSTLRKMELSSAYSSKILNSMNKLKQEVEKKEKSISNLKVKNHNIEREKSLFFSALSRSLRTPLNSIIGYSENLYSTEKIDEIHPIVNEIIIESDKMFQAINNIMDFSSKDFTDKDLELKDFRMKEIYENTVYGSPQITAFKNKIDYISEKDSDKVLILGNPQIYKQILTSIFHYLLNMDPGKIEITISNTEITKEYINLIVKFRGEDLKYADFSFDDSVKSSRDTFKKYIKLYGIQFNEEINDSNYAIDFNFLSGLSQKNKKNQKSKKTESLILSKSLAVLVVEDYLPNLNILKMHLTKMGCEVFTATNGEHAISIFKREDIDLILMDIQMPIMDGWKTTEAIRSTAKGLDTMIIGLTASSLELDIRHCFESGMDDVQVKPIRKNQLFKKLNSFEEFKPERFPNLASLRADYRLSKVETETLFSSSIKQIDKQLEILDMLISADDNHGIEKLMPALINASLNINAFYYSRLLRNFFNAYKNREKERVSILIITLKNIINEVKLDNAELFRA